MVHVGCRTHQGQRACALCFVFFLIVNFQTRACHKFSSHRGERSASRSSPPDTYGNSDGSEFRGSHQISPAPAPGGGNYVHVTPSTAPPGRQKIENVFLKKIFEEYGHNGVISFEGFEHLLDKLGIGNLAISDHDIDDHFKSGHFQTLHENHHYHPHDICAHHQEYHHQAGSFPRFQGTNVQKGGLYHPEDATLARDNTQGHDDSHEEHSANRPGNISPHPHLDIDAQSEKDYPQTGSYMTDTADDIHQAEKVKPTDPTQFKTTEVKSLHSKDAEESASHEPDDKNIDVNQISTTDIPESTMIVTLREQSNQSDTQVGKPDSIHSALRQQRLSESQQAGEGKEEGFRSRRLSSVKPTTGTITDHPSTVAIKHASSEITGGHNRRHALRHHKHTNTNQHDERRHWSQGQVDGSRIKDNFRRKKRDIRKTSNDGDLGSIEGLPSSGRKPDGRRSPVPDSDGSLNTDTTKRRTSGDTHDDEAKSITEKCLTGPQLFNMYVTSGDGLSEEDFIAICPALIFQINANLCAKPRPLPTGPAHDHLHSLESLESSHRHGAEEGGHAHNESIAAIYDPSKVPERVWGYAFLSVIIISLVGLLGVAVVPIMQKVFYNHLLQFLVALAIGSLIGDALLHLIPHAYGSSHASHNHAHGEEDEIADDDSHQEGIWRGLVGLGGIYLFFLIERLMAIVTDWRRRVNKHKSRMRSPKLFRTAEEHESEVGAKLSKHSDIITSCEEIVMIVHPDKDVRNMVDDIHEELHRDCDPQEKDQLHHSHAAHGHGHSHGKVPNTVASVAWMVIMGDGLHNFSDGLAIGAAFANSMTGGLSTSVAVFCHELPHEIGDFAVLLRAGMSVKQAVVYNCVSSVLCLVGMVIGVCVGNIGSVSLWIFSLTAGIFIYIALVDMLPELTSVQPKRGENPLVHLALQNVGMLTGAGIMLLIAIYEDDIKLPHFEP